GSIPTPFPSQSDLASELANSDYYGVVNPPSATVSATSNVIIIPGLQANTLYNLKIYDTWNPSGSLLLYSPITSNGSGVISFGLDMSYLPPSANSNPPYPDYAFIITKNIQSGQEPQNPPGNGKLARQNSSSINFSDNNNASAIVNIYPIPSSEKLFVQFDKSAWENPKFSLVDQLGKEIEMVLDLDNGLVVRNIPTGFYILKIKDRNKEISSKVIIQH
ncbi:MAG: T9SS type A sorting domain-containing protein, partial [Bacteroidia bacterium]|nr:T9SS type A sorting domain-containing protein [Bacteroidia bacterium]